MLAIKLKRVGKKGQASFRIIVVEKRRKIFGKFTADLGFWNPRTDKYSIDKDEAKYWLKVGAQPTATVFNLLVKAGILKGPKIAVHKKSKSKDQNQAEQTTSPSAANG